MKWFRRRKAAKPLKVRPSVAEAVAEAERVHAFASNDVLRSSPTARSIRRNRRISSRSSASLRDPEKHSPTLNAAFFKEQGLPHPLDVDDDDDDITALPHSRRLAQSPHLRAVEQHDGGIPYNFQANPQSSLTSAQRGRLQRPQSLRKPANESMLLRQKSTKKHKRDDHLREEEIRAMSTPLPQKRPAGNSAGMLRRDSKKVKGPLNHRFERPTSDVSLPLEDSVHSSMSGGSDQRAFRVSALDLFSPRPTIRCSVGTQQYYAGTDTSPTSNKSKNSTVRSKRRGSISKEEMDSKRSSRIDDLADSLDAGALREILERDKRRKDKKRRAEEERMHRRLERRAEKQRAAEAGHTAGETATRHRGTHGSVGLGIGQETATPMEDVRPSTPQKPQVRTSTPPPKSEEATQLPTPLESPTDEPVVSDAQQAIRYSRGSVSGPSHTRVPSNVSHLPELLSKRLAEESPVDSVEHPYDPMTSGSLHAVETVDTTSLKKSTGRRRSSEGRRMSYFASFFRRRKRSPQGQGRATPSEVSFSNTSRESMSRQPLPAHLVASTHTPTPPIQIKRPSHAPRRTMSKFREDLPEFPMSPPESRVQSPEKPAAAVFAGRRQTQRPADVHAESNSSGARTDSPVSPGLPNPGPMSQSLASVDSEGSWLSGKPIKRASNKSHLRSSVGSASALKRTEEFNASYEDLGIPDDEYFTRLTARPDERRRSATSGEALTEKPEAGQLDDASRPSEEEEEELVQSSVGRQPTIIHRRPRIKSAEGLLTFYQQDASSPEGNAKAHTAEIVEGDSPTSDGEPIVVQRAKSIELSKQHYRQLSAGSAKLLDIGKRTSTSSQSKLQRE
ncbi:hypothetical protein P280DRAFT_513488 [Massarina eburnea CBS 473.64]|uniref:Uncharacterized protein n=1 Tax=Massarina eburnea CBS 473.64 TaxID=1395130 RepID=A0A6A6SFY6_9PLEO|nr:hypothetical protein P280DRAFT_513488 [Massarina eburnea CBS 473.64]